jgi:hypothetical protein
MDRRYSCGYRLHTSGQLLAGGSRRVAGMDQMVTYCGRSGIHLAGHIYLANASLSDEQIMLRRAIMNKSVIVDGKEFMIQQENANHYNLIEYAPDGEGVRFIVSKQDCKTGADGKIYASQYTVDANY